jgi:hypothetical protein
MTIRLLMFTALFHFALLSPVAAQSAQKDDRTTKARASAEEIAADSKPNAAVKLRSGEKIKGKITAVSNDSFSIADSKSGISQTILFSDVEQIKRSRRGLSTGAWITIGVAATAAIIVGAIFGRYYCNEAAC